MISLKKFTKTNMIELIKSEAISKKPKPKTIEKDIKRFKIYLIQPFFGFSLMRQIMLMESCMSMKTLVDAKIKVPKPMRIPIFEFAVISILSKIVCS